MMGVESLYCQVCRNNRLHYNPVDDKNPVYVCMACGNRRTENLVLETMAGMSLEDIEGSFRILKEGVKE